MTTKADKADNVFINKVKRLFCFCVNVKITVYMVCCEFCKGKLVEMLIPLIWNESL